MKEDRAAPPAPAIDGLRVTAEERLRETEALATPAGTTESDVQRLLHELQVHQIELEMQNVELLRLQGVLQGELDVSRGAWEDLFEFAPVGYCTLDGNGRILQLNLAGASLLGAPRGQLLRKRLALYLAEASRLTFRAFLAEVLAGRSAKSCDLTLQRAGDKPVHVHLAGVAVLGTGECRITMMDITDRKRAEDELHRFFDLVPDLVCIASADGFFKKVNRAWGEVLGYSEEELLRTPLVEFIHPEDRAATLAEVARQIAGGKTFDFVNRYRCKDGSYRWFEWVANPAVNGTMLFAAARDITGRKQAEDSLRKSEETHRSILQTAMDGFCLLDTRGHFLEVNEAYIQMIGYSEQELLSMRISDVEANEKPEETATHLQTLVARGHDRFETRQRRKDGTVFDVEVGTQYKPIEEGRVVAFLRDITERRRAEAEVGRLNRLYAALIEINEATVRAGSPEDLYVEVPRILVMTGAFKMVWIGRPDPATSRVMVLSRHGDSTGSLDRVSIYADERPEGMGPTGRAIREGRSFVTNDYLSDQATGPWHEEARRSSLSSAGTFPLRMEEGGKGALCVYSGELNFFGDREVALLEKTANNISYAVSKFEQERLRRQAEEQVRHLNASLELRVSERTTQLEEANKELESFSYSVSHDLRAPLRAIEGFSVMLVKASSERLNPEDQRRLDVIRTNARKMSALIDALLSFSRASLSEMKKVPIDMISMVKELVGEIVPDGQWDRFEVRVGELSSAMGDPEMIRVVLLNLLSNAVKYSGKREHSVIEVGSGAGPDGPEYFVKDNGAGFDPNYADKLFGVFQRLHGVTEFEGTGIGLALVKRIVERHGGRVWAEGAVGEGATFSFSLPMKKETEAPVATTQAGIRRVPPSGPARGRVFRRL